MSSMTQSGGRLLARGVTPGTRLGMGVRFDVLFAFLSMIFTGGLYLDGWAHAHDRVDESFFTPWHAFFYSGFLLTALTLALVIALNRSRGRPWHEVAPAGYELSVLGALIFAAGGIGDLVWHELFGIEEGFEALLSPSHLTLALSLALITSGPFRAAWRRTNGGHGWSALAPALVSLCCLTSVGTFIMMYGHPIVAAPGGVLHRDSLFGSGQVASAMGLLVITAILIGPLLLAWKRWTLPRGAITAVWGANMVAMAILNWHHDYALAQLFMMLGAVAVTDLLVPRLRAAERPEAAHRFGLLAPMILWGIYFLSLAIFEGIGWTVHLWAGLVVLTGITGWLMSYLVFPPSIPPEA